MRKIYIREYYYEHDDWGGPARKKFVLEVESEEVAKRWIINEIAKWKKDGISKDFTIVVCEEKEFRIGDAPIIEVEP